MEDRGDSARWREILTGLAASCAESGPSLAGISRGDADWQAVGALVRSVAGILSRQRPSSVDDDVDDAVQTVLLKLQDPGLLRRLKSLNAPQGYLIVMVRHTLADLARRRQREVPADQVDLPRILTEEWSGPGETGPDLEVPLAHALRQLAPEERELISLRFWSGLSIAEIARRRHEPYSRVAVRLFRLLRRLRARIESDPVPAATS